MANPTDKTSAQRLTAAQRRAYALELRQAGNTFSDIGLRVGCSTARAHQYVNEELRKLAEKSEGRAGTLRQLEAERLDHLMASIWPKAEEGDLRAVDRIIRIMERRARLFGLDAPNKVAATNPDGDEEAAQGVVVVPAPAASIEEWLDQAEAHQESRGEPH